MKKTLLVLFLGLPFLSYSFEAQNFKIREDLKLIDQEAYLIAKERWASLQKNGCKSVAEGMRKYFKSRSAELIEPVVTTVLLHFPFYTESSPLEDLLPQRFIVGDTKRMLDSFQASLPTYKKKLGIEKDITVSLHTKAESDCYYYWTSTVVLSHTTLRDPLVAQGVFLHELGHASDPDVFIHSRALGIIPLLPNNSPLLKPCVDLCHFKEHQADITPLLLGKKEGNATLAHLEDSFKRDYPEKEASYTHPTARQRLSYAKTVYYTLCLEAQARTQKLSLKFEPTEADTAGLEEITLPQ